MGNKTVCFSGYTQWIPETVRMLRGKQRLKDIATKAGISISYLSDIEHGRANPSIATLDAVFVACGSKLVIGYETDDEVCQSKRDWVFIERDTIEHVIKTLADKISQPAPPTFKRGKPGTLIDDEVEVDLNDEDESEDE